MTLLEYICVIERRLRHVPADCPVKTRPVLHFRKSCKSLDELNVCAPIIGSNDTMCLKTTQSLYQSFVVSVQAAVSPEEMNSLVWSRGHIILPQLPVRFIELNLSEISILFHSLTTN